jgi:hypothetical protein
MLNHPLKVAITVLPFYFRFLPSSYLVKGLVLATKCTEYGRDPRFRDGGSWTTPLAGRDEAVATNLTEIGRARLQQRCIRACIAPLAKVTGPI